MRAHWVGLLSLTLAACGATTSPDLDVGSVARDGAAIDGAPTISDARPAEDAAVGPREDAAAPHDDATAPTEDATAPAEDATAPAEDATAPAEDAAAPEEDAAAPHADATAPHEDGGVASPDATPPAEDATTPAPDAAPASDAGVASPDATPPAPDAGTPDAANPDAAPVDSGPTYNCGAFTVAPTWSVLTGYRAVVVADAQDGLNQPVALTFAGGAYSGRLYVVSQGNSTVHSVDVTTGATTVFTPAAAWAVPPRLLTTIVWDETRAFDGALYVGDQGTDADNDSVVFRVTATGTTTVFTAAPGPGLDDIYGLALSPGGTYPPGLYVSGDTDGARVDWGVFARTGVGAAFSEVAGVEGMAVDRAGLYGGGVFASRPLGGGYAGDGTITRIRPDGTADPPLVSNLGGVHAVIVAPNGAGAFGSAMLAARWDTGQLLRVEPTGAVTVLASLLSLTNYDGNILTFSPDGNVVYVADRQANRVVCIEPVP